jgi:hypothetical protein
MPARSGGGGSLAKWASGHKPPFHLASQPLTISSVSLAYTVSIPLAATISALVSR